jgi:asparagine synthase (glutamine-hydrolysing)
MCGIAGFAGPGTREDLARMIGCLQRRGPDAQTFWSSESPRLMLGHARLSVLDHAGGAQPMWTADRQVGIVFNGEIYNFAELRRDLEAAGCRFASDHSDTEVVLQAYRTWGERCVERFNGMWAFVIADLGRGRLFASRDRFGKKPLYYLHDGTQLVFASQADALRRHPAGAAAPLDTLAIKKFLCHGYIPAPRTLWAGVRKLPAGCNFGFDLRSGVLAVERYWQFRLEPGDTAPRTPQALLQVLEAAVERRLVADVPVGTFLSGGIDSSVVSALAARRHGGRLMTFSIGFDEAGFDESAHARAVARHIGSEHFEERMGIDAALEIAADVLGALDEPTGDSSVLPTALVSRVARRHVTVALGGDGADELFAGYAPFKALAWAQRVERWLPRPAISALRGAVGRLPVSHGYMSLDFKLKRGMAGLGREPALRLPVWMAPMEPADVNALVRDGTEHSPEEIFSEQIEAWSRAGALGEAEGMLQQFTELYLQEDILPKVDRASMQHSLEVRAPFLDIEVADFARRLPTHCKFAGGQTKRLLREAAQGLIPQQVLQRPKQGFAVPIGQWFAQGRLELNVARLPACIDRERAAALLQRHRQHRSDERLALWSLLSLAASANRPS